MAFVNEYVEQREIEEYKLNDLKNFYDQNEDHNGDFFPNDMYQHYWTIDREKNVWLMFCGTFREKGFNIREDEYSREKIFILYYKGVPIDVRLELDEESTISIYDTPYKRIWNFISITPNTYSSSEYSEIKQLLFKALKVFGDDGIQWQVENTIVELNFID